MNVQRTKNYVKDVRERIIFLNKDFSNINVVINYSKNREQRIGKIHEPGISTDR